MTDNEKINGWTFEETVKTAENIMEFEKNMFKWDALRHIRDFAEMYEEELQRYRVLGTVEELRIAKEKQIPKKPDYEGDGYADGQLVYDYAKCPICGHDFEYGINDWECEYCSECGQKLDWSDTD